MEFPERWWWAVMASLLGAWVLCVSTDPAPAASGGHETADLSVTKLWNYRPDGQPNFVCSGFYPDLPPPSPASEWLVSSAHCQSAILADRVGTSGVFGVVVWRASVMTKIVLSGPFYSKTDVAVAVVAGLAAPVPKRKLATRSAPAGAEVLVHGFPGGAEKVVRGSVSSYFDGTAGITVPCGSLTPGVSGSPVSTPDGEVVAVLWGIDDHCSGDSMIVMATPVETLVELLRLARAETR